jgi:transcription initiation factor TFIID TATA-box-binding protein
VEHNPQRFQAVFFRIEEPRATALVFRTGMVQLLGLKTEDDARVAVHKFERFVKLLGYPNLRLENFQITSMSAKINCNFSLRLKALVQHLNHRQGATYNPELSAGAIYKKPELSVTLVICEPGKVVMSGARNQEMLLQATESVSPILQLFWNVDVGPPEKAVESFASGFEIPQKRTERSHCMIRNFLTQDMIISHTKRITSDDLKSQTTHRISRSVG